MKKLLALSVLLLFVVSIQTTENNPTIDSHIYYGETYQCPVDNCRLFFNGDTQDDEYGHFYYVYECPCCGRKFAIRR